jgi:chemotaxis protein MotB
VAQVRGFADQLLRVPNNPNDPSNRRISLIVQYLDDHDKETGETAEKMNELSGGDENPSGHQKPPEEKPSDQKPSPAQPASEKH